MTREESKIEILKKVESGILSVEEGSDLLGIFDQADEDSRQADHKSGSINVEPMAPMEKPQVSGCWKAAWSMILVGGAVLTGFSAYWIFKAFENNGFGWGFFLSWIPLILGVFIMIGGWILLESPWMHVRVHSQEDEKKVHIVFSMPVPLRLARWIFEHFGHLMPAEVREKGVGEMLGAIEESLKNGEPFHVQVDDDKDGSKVEVFMG
jgi:hypothetical protein